MVLVLCFLLNDNIIHETDLPADLTVLEYLRNHQQLTGTKEGCASGDCGACTVVVAEVVAGRLQYESINSCIAFMGALHGKQLITVEHLAQGDKLHPAQQAMVDCHGSQCGFCTPGFVMSLFAMSKKKWAVHGSPTRQQIDENLGGNLCRCTGYRPIIDAATLALQTAGQQSDKFSDNETAVVDILESITDESSHQFFHRPRQLTGLYSLIDQHPDAPLLAGGTDLALEVTQNLRQYPTVICLKNIDELRYCRSEDGYWAVGAGCTLSDFLVFFGALNSDIETLLQRFGSTQVRNQGTVGGNIANASPIGDLPPLCIALGAQLVLESVSGKRVIALQDFFIDYKKTDLKSGEIVSELRIPQSALKGKGDEHIPHCRVYKISKRYDDDISAVCAAFNFQLDNGRFKSIRAAFGGMAAIPKRAINLEKVLQDQQLTAQILSAADSALAKDFQPISDARASAEYRLQVSRNLLRRLALEIESSEITSRVHDHVD